MTENNKIFAVLGLSVRQISVSEEIMSKGTYILLQRERVPTYISTSSSAVPYCVSNWTIVTHFIQGATINENCYLFGYRVLKNGNIPYTFIFLKIKGKKEYSQGREVVVQRIALCCLCAASRLVLLTEAEVVCINSTCFSTFMANANLTNIIFKMVWEGTSS